MSGSAARVAAIGEGMLELAGASGGLRLGYGGDTLNAAVYLARLGVRVDYVTALGDDEHSGWMLEAWQAEGLGTGLVARFPGRLPGLYMISTGAGGERRFSYWRSAAPARELFDDPARVAALGERLRGCRWVYVSGITLSLYGQEARERLFGLLEALRGDGAQIAFDSNYRPAGWTGADAARAAISRAWGCTDLALPTFEDEQALFGDAAPEATLARLQAAGAAEIALKLGGDGCLLQAGQGKAARVPAQAVAAPVDTTAAGDSFNAAYLAARLKGAAPEAAAHQGHRLAAAVIQCPGAILPKADMPAPE